MRILMIAPEPFFEPRGTPFSEYHRIRALLDLGHTVDLVTYPFGKDVTLPGLRIFRAARPPFITRVKIGPSPAKLFLDMTLTLTALNRARKAQYDAVHSHEEGAAIGVVISAALGIPHLYDMHSSLPQQLENFAFSRSSVLRWMFQVLERTAIKRSRVTIVICPHLEVTARKVVPDARVVLIENAPGSGDVPIAGSGTAVRTSLGIDAATPMVLYTGTFEAYQGLDLLFDAAKAVRAKRPDARFVLAGGKPDQVARAKAHAEAAGAAGLIFTGELPSETIPAYLDAADILVSPRSTGTNTPLKIYQYLRSGRVIVATRLLTHTQVLSEEVAILTEPTADGFARGILQAIADPAAARRIGDAAKRLAETRYTYEAYLQRTREACAALVA
jgi:glycosyltransferase involved in cell wall biosynthesis